MLSHSLRHYSQYSQRMLWHIQIRITSHYVQTLRRVYPDITNHKLPHNSSHFRDTNLDTYQQRSLFPQSIPNTTFPLSQSLYSSQTHISVILANISQEHLVTVVHVCTNVSREVHEIPFPYFWKHKSRNCRTLKQAAKNKTTKAVKLNLRDNVKVGGPLLKSKPGFMRENSQRESKNWAGEGEKMGFIQWEKKSETICLHTGTVFVMVSKNHSNVYEHITYPSV